MSSNIKTFFLLALLSGLILFIGRVLGGSGGLMIALILALVMNVGSYWFSDKIILSAYKAKELSASEAPMLYTMVRELSARANIPMPRICLIPDDSPNAFATGRDPEHAVVAVTEGILRLLSPEELRGVVAHEIGHIANRDILIQSVAGVMATVIMFAAQMLKFAAIFGGGSRDSENSSGGGIIAALLVGIFAPIAASLIHLAISRSREYYADATGAKICGKPQALASALRKLTNQVERHPMRHGGEATAHMFIVNPFSKGTLTNLFSTHPPVEERIRRLMAMAK